jgi:hypothetical protein
MELLGDIDWTAVLQAVGSVTVTVLGVLFGFVLKWKITNASIRRDNEEAEEKRAAAAAAGERRDRKDTIQEYRELTELHREEAERREAQMVEIRNDAQTYRTESALFRYRLDVCEWDREDLRDRLDDLISRCESAGIVVPPWRSRRPPPTAPESMVGPPKPGGGEATAK